jgi:hypothetical protein
MVLVLLMAEKALILSVPLSTMPILVLLFAHDTVADLTESRKTTVVTVAPLHTVISDGVGIVGFGATVMVNDCTCPVQPFADGVTDTVDITAIVSLPVAVNAAIVSAPVDAKPIPVLLLTHA